MSKLRYKVSDIDLLRIGAYAQMEGSFRTGIKNRFDYRFTFAINQIVDMEELISRVVTNYRKDGPYIEFYSKDLYESLSRMGFHDFRQTDWNVPRCINWSQTLKNEYIRAVIDSLGDIDIEQVGYPVPYIRILSVNGNGLKTLRSIYGGHLYTYGNMNYLQWKGSDVLRLLDMLQWRFYCHRNIRGADIVRGVRWDVMH